MNEIKLHWIVCMYCFLVNPQCVGRRSESSVGMADPITTNKNYFIELLVNYCRKIT